MWKRRCGEVGNGRKEGNEMMNMEERDEREIEGIRRRVYGSEEVGEGVPFFPTFHPRAIITHLNDNAHHRCIACHRYPQASNRNPHNLKAFGRTPKPRVSLILLPSSPTPFLFVIQPDTTTFPPPSLRVISSYSACRCPHLAPFPTPGGGELIGLPMMSLISNDGLQNLRIYDRVKENLVYLDGVCVKSELRRGENVGEGIDVAQLSQRLTRTRTTLVLELPLSHPRQIVFTPTYAC